jgi:hypothetical protein
MHLLPFSTNENKKPTCIAYTNMNEYNIQTCGFHQTFKKKIVF